MEDPGDIKIRKLEAKNAKAYSNKYRAKSNNCRAYRKSREAYEDLIEFFEAVVVRYRLAAKNANRKIAHYGKRMIRYLQEMFSTIHLREQMTEVKWKRRMNIHKKNFLKSLQWGIPDDKMYEIL